MHSNRRGLLFILSSPSGAGKTTLSRLLLKNDPHITLSVSATTRPKRQGEVDGVDYHFISKETFDTMVEKGEFLEYANVFSAQYGTPKQQVENVLASGKDVLFDIDWQGTETVTAKARADVVSIFILPPSMQELERRLHTRAQDSEEVIQKRMSKAAEEISHWHSYDYVIINEDIEQSLQHITTILAAERLKRARQTTLDGFIGKLIG